MVHVCLNLIADYSHVLQNFFSVCHLTIEREKNRKRIMFVDVANEIFSLSLLEQRRKTSDTFIVLL